MNRFSIGTQLLACRNCITGNVGVIFGLALVPLVLAAGSALDYSRASNVKTTLQLAADAAALAGDAVSPWSVATCEKQAKDYFKNNVVSEQLSVVGSPTVSCAQSGTSVTATGQVNTTLLGVMGLNKVDVAASSQTTCALQSTGSGGASLTPAMWQQTAIPNMTRIVTLGEFSGGVARYFMTPEGNPIVRLDNPHPGPATIVIRSVPDSPVGNMSFNVPSQGQFIVVIPWTPNGRVSWWVEEGPHPKTGGSATWSNVNRIELTPDMIPGTPVDHEDGERKCWISK